MAGTNGTTRVCPAPASTAEPGPRRQLARLTRGGCRGILAVVFLMAGVTKVTDLHGFADQLLLHSGLPPTVALAVAAFLPWLELTCAACLLAGYAVREAAALLAFLVIIFLAYGLWQGNEAECGCFLFPRFQKHPLGWWPLLRNLLLLGCALRTAWR